MEFSVVDLIYFTVTFRRNKCEILNENASRMDLSIGYSVDIDSYIPNK